MKYFLLAYVALQILGIGLVFYPATTLIATVGSFICFVLVRNIIQEIGWPRGEAPEDDIVGS